MPPSDPSCAVYHPEPEEHLPLRRRAKLPPATSGRPPQAPTASGALVQPPLGAASIHPASCRRETSISGPIAAAHGRRAELHPCLYRAQISEAPARACGSVLAVQPVCDAPLSFCSPVPHRPLEPGCILIAFWTVWTTQPMAIPTRTDSRPARLRDASLGTAQSRTVAQRRAGLRRPVARMIGRSGGWRPHGNHGDINEGVGLWRDLQGSSSEPRRPVRPYSIAMLSSVLMYCILHLPGVRIPVNTITIVTICTTCSDTERSPSATVHSAL